ncbi:MAG: CARDB domain-containing protein [Pirellulaceae bacterium]|nr:CARDB domain-containing protein [Pirellulaceae bacterium]
MFNLTGWWFVARSSRRRGCERPVQRAARPLRLERLETRATPASLADLAAVAIDLGAVAAAGGTVQASAKVKNSGDKSSGTFTVQFKLVSEATQHETLLASVSRSSLNPGKSSSFSQSLTIPASLADGTYRLRMILDPANKIREKSEANNALADATSTELRHNTLFGTASYGGVAKPVSIRTLNPLESIASDVSTWIVIHGRNSSPSWAPIQQIASAIDQELPDDVAVDQVLVLDWSNPANNGLFGGGGENYIRPIAQWAATTLVGAGLTADELNLVGHSWGAYVGSEMAEVLVATTATEVNSILALDAAADFPGGSYNPEKAGEVNFAANSRLSWAFYDADGDIYGSAITPLTADEAIVVRNSAHSPLVQAVADLIALPDGHSLAAMFALSRLLAADASDDWTADSFTAAGSYSAAGRFEAVLYTTSGGTKIQSLQWFTASGLVTLPV